ncbi:MAG: hypothetical protein ACYDBS_02055 [Acidimicrobiales bacterium]
MTARSRSLLAEVLRWRRDGAQVEVLSPTDLSVAHRYLEDSWPMSAIEIAIAARGADVVVVQLQPGFPIAESAGRATRAAGLSSLAVALRRAKCDVVLRLHTIHDLPRGVGGRAAESLWATATRIEVGDEETREQLSSLLGRVSADKIALALPPVLDGCGRESSADLGGDASLDSVSAVVRARAARERARVLADVPDWAGQLRSRTRVSLWEWVPHPGTGVPDLFSPMATAARQGSVAGRAARAVLYAAESRRVTRPMARGARLVRRLAAKT